MSESPRASFVTTANGFESLREEWNNLLDRAPMRSVFLRWEWLYSWWREIGLDCALRIVVVRDDRGRLVGLGPFCVRRGGGPFAPRMLSFLGTDRVSSEYLDIVTESQTAAAVTAEVWAAILSDRRSWDGLEFTDLLEESTIRVHLGPLARASGFTVLERPRQVCPYLSLGQGREGFWASLGPSQRANLRRRTRKFVEGNATFESVLAPELLPETLDLLYDLHARRWATRGRAGNLADGAIQRFHHRVVDALGQQGLVRLYTLRMAERAVACLYGFEYKGTLFYYQSGFDPVNPAPHLPGNLYTPGFVLMGWVLQDAAMRGVAEFDFLRGPEPYKLRWSRSSRQTRVLAMLPPGPGRARAQATLGEAIRSIKRRIRAWIPSPGTGD